MNKVRFAAKSWLKAQRPGRALSVLRFFVVPFICMEGCSRNSARYAPTPATKLLGTSVAGKTHLAYRLIDLGSLQYYSYAYGINDRSQVVGSCDTEAGTKVYLWQDGKMQDLGRLADFEKSIGSSISSSGEIVGNATNGGDVWTSDRSAIVIRNGKLERLFPKGKDSAANSINDAGEIVGEMTEDGVNAHAFLWRKGVVTDIGSLQGGATTANMISKSGQIVGYSRTETRNYHAFLWESGKMRDLGTLGGGYSEANGINDKGQVVGVANTINEVEHACLWESDGVYDLGPDPRKGCTATSINISGQVVGGMQVGPKANDNHAAAWLDRTMYDLNNLIAPGSGWKLLWATGINDRGEIVGNGTVNGGTRAFLLVPIESST